MKLLIGLGNPGTKYKNNRHNVGYMFVDWVNNSQLTVGNDVKLLKTDCFMNESGKFVRKQMDFYKVKPEDLYIVHDDLDLRLGKYKDPSLRSGTLRSSASPAGLKIQFGVGPKVHYGIQSVEKGLGTKDFWRIRIGVDNRDPNDRTPGDAYVLQDFTAEEKKILEGVFDAILKDDSVPR